GRRVLRDGDVRPMAPPVGPGGDGVDRGRDASREQPARFRARDATGRHRRTRIAQATILRRLAAAIPSPPRMPITIPTVPDATQPRGSAGASVEASGAVASCAAVPTSATVE